jgi:hypothetical protein
VIRKESEAKRMSEDLCSECVEELRQMAHAKMAAHSGDKDAKKEVEALAAAGVPEDISEEVRSMLNTLVRKRNEIAETGRYKQISYIDSFINSAKAHYLGKEYDLALDNIAAGIPEVDSAYNLAVYQVEAVAKLAEVEGRVNTLQAKPSVQAPGASQEATKQMDVLVAEAKKLMADGKFKEATEKLTSVMPQGVNTRQDPKNFVGAPTNAQMPAGTPQTPQGSNVDIDEAKRKYDEETIMLSNMFNEMIQTGIDRQKLKKMQETEQIPTSEGAKQTEEDDSAQ